MTNAIEAARLIGLDWGTTHARSYLLAPGTGAPQLLDQRAGDGILSVSPDDPDRDAAFNAILRTLVADWQQASPGLPMIACGMVGAAQGWREASYRSLPTPLAGDGGMTMVDTDFGALPIIAGVKKSRPNADVIRGEETQLAGLVPELAAGRTTLVVMPGTHTKWAQVRDGVLLDFDTAMSGELFALLADRSMVGRAGAPPEPGQDWRTGFDWGLDRAGHTDALAFAAFVIRSSVLDAQLPASQVRDAISGLLIGSEVADRATKLDLASMPIVLVGGAELTGRYQRALARHGVSATLAPDDVTIRGLWRSAVGAGLVGE